MKKILVLAMMLILLTSCIVVEEAPSEEEPVKEVVVKEVVKEAEKEPEVKQVIKIEKNLPLENPIPAFLDALPEGYWYYTVNNKIEAKVFNDWRASMWREVSRKWDLAKWNPETKEVYVLFGEISDYGLSKVRGNGTGSIDETHMAYMKIPMEAYPYSPVDWMEMFSNGVPAKKDTAEQVLHVEDRYYSSNLSLIFEKENGEGVILRFDNKYRVPVVVERTFEGATVERIQYKFDTVVYDDLNKRTKQITKEMVEMPEEFIVFTEEEARAYVKGEYFRDPLQVNPIIVLEQVKQVFAYREGMPKATY
ncbi:hypothetical protein KY338_04895 [Candidatus Woesearchaeota archaeon]|nr:hypothetical protein [Candidatus Woesearchaeota archaeon]MBW3006242.1 hypothetical protein [Candidatus Woesearchaeota archaeon]